MSLPRKRSKRTRIVLLGWYGSDNLGDEAVLQAVVEALQARGFTDLYILSVDPAKTQAKLSLPAGPRAPWSLQALRAMWGARALVLGGGGLIQDGTSVYNLPIYTLFVMLARLFGLKVVAWGLGVEPIFTLLGKLQARYVCRVADHFSVRDFASKRLLVKAGVPSQRIKITADPAFLIMPDPYILSEEASVKPRVIFCLRHLSDNHPGINLHYLLPVSVRKRFGVGWKPPIARHQRFIEAMARGVKVCTEEFGATVALLPLWPGRDDDVLAEVEQAAIKLGVQTNSLERADIMNTPSSIAGYVGSADLLVSMRLHALIFGARQAVPMLAISYARKVRGLMRTLGAERWVVEVETRNPPPEEVEMKLRLLWQLREEESRKLERAGDEAHRRAQADADHIAFLLDTIIRNLG
ncbi:MAG TPA: polysaccharide pyruvyl transferase family protein [Chloroflexia bacterium]|nr:polysaccharide pyruvyl transferase family protein [Chloroflexia bacterium]